MWMHIHMRIINNKPKAFLSNTTSNRFPRSMRKATAVACIMGIAWIHHPTEARGETLSGPYQVNLSWDAHADPAVTGYRVYFGTASGVYVGSMAVGGTTTASVPGLADGVSYFFALTAVNSSGLESDFSAEVSFLPGNKPHASGIRAAENGGKFLTISGMVGQNYDIEASKDLKTWAIIHTVTLGDGGSLEFSDPDAALYPTRFYRTRQSP